MLGAISKYSPSVLLEYNWSEHGTLRGIHSALFTTDALNFQLLTQLRTCCFIMVFVKQMSISSGYQLKLSLYFLRTQHRTQKSNHKRPNQLPNIRIRLLILHPPLIPHPFFSFSLSSAWDVRGGSEGWEGLEEGGVEGVACKEGDGEGCRGRVE
jgi:hypothetical protein